MVVACYKADDELTSVRCGWQIPDEMLDESSPAYNKGRMWLFESPSEVARAYQRQSMLDMKNFLQARAAELVSGGLLFFVCGASLSSEPDEVGMNFLINNFCERDLQEVWSDLIAEVCRSCAQRQTVICSLLASSEIHLKIVVDGKNVFRRLP